MILRLYTVKDPIPLFKHVNFILNSTDREAAGLRYIKRFVKLLLSAGNSLTAAGYGITAVAHRGLRVEGNFSLQRKCETAKTMFAKMTLAGFTSVSIDPGVAGQFGDRLFFHFPNVRGVRIGCLSCFPAEQEILVLPPAVFCVEESHHLDGKITVVLNHAQQESASYLLTTPCNTNGDEQLLENYKEVMCNAIWYPMSLMCLHRICMDCCSKSVVETTRHGKSCYKPPLNATSL